ncbi:MAG: hypothetical protein M2R45_02199 [Verrucomicrobia subdivision 3 bacterium]|nr:hypothetical protein [Limisphaerales bacterium]MCS1413775.1 hypothetical protein [Limisphaerales bacterium]
MSDNIKDDSCEHVSPPLLHLWFGSEGIFNSYLQYFSFFSFCFAIIISFILAPWVEDWAPSRYSQALTVALTLVEIVAYIFALPFFLFVLILILVMFALCAYLYAYWLGVCSALIIGILCICLRPICPLIRENAHRIGKFAYNWRVPSGIAAGAFVGNLVGGAINGQFDIFHYGDSVMEWGIAIIVGWCTFVGSVFTFSLRLYAAAIAGDLAFGEGGPLLSPPLLPIFGLGGFFFAIVGACIGRNLGRKLGAWEANIIDTNRGDGRQMTDEASGGGWS